MTEAWPRLAHVFSFGGPDPSGASLSRPGARPPKRLLSSHPVDLLVVDLGSRQPGKPCPEEPWYGLVSHAPIAHRPLTVVESWPAAAASWESHPMTKGAARAWNTLGYESRFRLVPTTWVGGAIDQTRLLVVRFRSDRGVPWHWGPLTRPNVFRPMANLLIPHGLLPSSVKQQVRLAPSSPAPDSATQPMPYCLGAWIHTDRGTRRLQIHELARGLGVPTSQTLTANDKLWKDTTSVFIWEYLSVSLRSTPPPITVIPPLFSDWSPLGATPPLRGIQQSPRPTPSDTARFPWRPPDLSPDAPWHRTRVANLRAAAAMYPTRRSEIIRQGLTALTVHRGNYNADGTCLLRLQLLWWEFPPEHWDELRDGCDMGFLSVPTRKIHPNSPMDPVQLQVALIFVRELLSIGATRRLRDWEKLWCNAPIFCLPKEEQPGEHRVIADCKKGGQNAHIGGDPVYLNRPLHILEQMYSRGYSAVVDASKFFYQFLVRPADQLYFGVVDPLTGEHYAHTGLPMGSGSSPGLAGRFGLSFIRMLREQEGPFSRHLSPNCWWTSLSDEGYHPHLGYGFSMTRSNGAPSVKIWVHVDDFLIHGPDLPSTTEALRFFLDRAVDVGLLCHPKKLSPPAQAQRYCGFIFDTTTEPTLHIPQDKLERCQAMAHYLGHLQVGSRISRLALSVIAGTLESVADATPNRLGHTYLRATHGLIHPEGHTPGREIYFSFTEVTEPVLREMSWWLHILSLTGGRKVRSSRSGTLIPSWGDGSGTGTGGTIAIPGNNMHLWMGQWSPAVYSHTSNWKELKTLLVTLQQLGAMDQNPVEDATLFYFTDNSPTYWIAHARSSSSPGLHSLMEKIQLLTLKLGCHLEVVHVPGVVMIQQGTDGLSRGVWVSPYHDPAQHRILNAAVFAPMVPDRDLIETMIRDFSLPRDYVVHHYSDFHGKKLFDHFSVVFPPPETARLCLVFLLEAWVERPFTTSSLIFVPRVVAGFWSGLSRHLVELGEFRPSDMCGWTPIPGSGEKPCTGVMQTACVGCTRVPRPPENFLTCAFALTGFPSGRTHIPPCRNGYHPRCLRAGEPFTSRRPGGKGLVFPNVGYWASFICERCTVIAKLGRPLGHPGDRWLLQLERMRLLNMAHSWAESTTVGYQSQLRKVLAFEARHPGLLVLPRPVLPTPPVGLPITLAWAELDASVATLPRRGTWSERAPVFNTVRRIRSAVSTFTTWDAIHSHPHDNYFDNGVHRLGPVTGPSTGGFTLFSKGLAARIGDNPRQSTALLGRHASNLDSWMDAHFRSATSPSAQRDWALAGLAHLLLWLGWLRGGEAFAIRQADLNYIHPHDALTHDLPRGVGAVLVRMVEDKTHRNTDQHLVIAYRCLTGLSIGKWLQRVISLDLWDPLSDSPLFHHPSGIAWTSHFYRSRFLYPGLTQLRTEGDPFLSPFDGSDPTLTLPYRFWSLHCYRRGARTHCQRSQPDTLHKRATQTQIYKHARWRQPKGAAIDDTYRAWTLYDKLKITLMCH